jgi:hypothetical protein
MDRRPLGGNHHRPLLVAGLIPGDQGHSQLHPGRCWWAVHPRSVVVDRQRATLVQGTHHKLGRIRWIEVLVVRFQFGTLVNCDVQAISGVLVTHCCSYDEVLGSAYTVTLIVQNQEISISSEMHS